MYLYKSQTYLNDLSAAIKQTVGIERLKNSSVLITGASGLIGSFVVDMLLYYNKTDDANITVYAAGRSIERLEKRFEGAEGKNLIFVEHDVNCAPKFDFSLDYIIHAASNAYPQAFAKDPVGTVLSNVVGTQYLLEYAKEHNTKRFMFVSSGEVYGQCDSDITAFKESYSGYVDPTQPRSCYPASKRAAETLCVSYTAQYSLDTVIVRPCHIYGPNTTKSDNRASVQFMSCALKGEDIVLNSRGSQMRSYCYIADCGSALVTVLACGESANAYNIANPDARVTIAALAEEIAKCAGTKVVFSLPDEQSKGQQTPISYAVLDSDKLCSLGWKGKYSVKNGVSNTFNILKGE